MGLFGKKNCDICGAGIGMLGGKKVQDGNICKECLSKLSIWFEDRKESTVQDIKNQIAAREENRKLLNSFETSHAFGDYGCILIDKKNKQFVALGRSGEGLFSNAKTVTSLDEIIGRNPDIISFSQIRDIKVDIDEMTREEKKNVDGEMVSYSPKHMTYMETISIDITVKHPYIHKIHVQLPPEAIQIPCDAPRKKSAMNEKIAAKLFDSPEFLIENMEEAYDNNSLKAILTRNPYMMSDYAFGFPCSLRNKKGIGEYRYYLFMAKEIKRLLEDK